jgi:hypothetical protein
MYRSRELPARWASAPGIWKRSHPDYEYILWTDASLRELVRSNYPWLLETYDAYPYDTQRWDASRYAILHKHGGEECSPSEWPLDGVMLPHIERPTVPLSIAQASTWISTWCPPEVLTQCCEVSNYCFLTRQTSG